MIAFLSDVMREIGQTVCFLWPMLLLVVVTVVVFVVAWRDRPWKDR
jgi:hypothetical protein